MKKPQPSLLVIITMVFAAFTLGLYLGGSVGNHSITVNVSPSAYIPPTEAPTEQTLPPEPSVSYPLDINHASQAELMTLPGIGEKLALRILQRRWFQGDFTSVDQLASVKGIGENRLKEIRHLITIGG